MRIITTLTLSMTVTSKHLTTGQKMRFFLLLELVQVKAFPVGQTNLSVAAHFPFESHEALRA